MLIVNSHLGRTHMVGDAARAAIASVPTPPSRWGIAEQVEALRDELAAKDRPDTAGMQRRANGGPRRIALRMQALLAVLPPADAPLGLSRAELSKLLGWAEWMTSEVLAALMVERCILRRRSGSAVQIGCVTYRRPAEVRT